MKVTTTVAQPPSATLDKIRMDVITACASGLYMAGEYIMAQSKDLAPVDTGNLRASGFVELPDVSGAVVNVKLGYGGFSAAYALMVHENPRAGKTGGLSPSGRKYKTWAKVGQWKYLEKPFMEAVAQNITLRFIKQESKRRGLA